MLFWLRESIGSIVVMLILLTVVALIVRKMVRDKKAGRHICGGSCGSCPGSCSGCPMQGRCRGN